MLVEKLKSFRFAMELVLRGEGCALDWTMASIVAIRSSVRKHVKARCSGSSQAKTFMELLLNTAYAVPHLFGPMPASMEPELARNMADRLKVQPEPTLRKDSGSSDSQSSTQRKTESSSSSSAGSSNPQQLRFRKQPRKSNWKTVKTLSPINLLKTPRAEERTGPNPVSFLNAQASTSADLASFSGGFSSRGDLFSFSQASPNPGGGCPDERGFDQRSVNGLDSRRIVDAEGEVALITGSSGFRSHRYCYRGSPVVFQEGQQRDSSGSSSFRQSFSYDSICYKRGKNSNPQTLCGGLVGQEHSDQVQASPLPVLESAFLRKKEKWEISADPGSFKVEHLCSNPFVCNGDFRSNLKIRKPGHVGGEWM